MATKSKVPRAANNVEAKLDAANAPTSTVGAIVISEENQEKAFLDQMREMISFDGPLQEIKCPVEGYEDVIVWYNVENDYGIAELFRMKPASLAPIENYRLWALFVRKVKWNFSVDPPTPSDPHSYRVLIVQFASLLAWIIGEGYEQAKKARLGN